MKAAAFLLIVLTMPLMAGSYRLLSDTLDLEVGTYRFIKFRVSPEMSDSTFITGEFETEPVPAKMEFILISELDYIRGWEGRGNIDTLGVLYAEHGPLVMEVPDFGDFVLVVSNRGNTDPVSLVADLSVSYKGSGIMYDSLPFGLTLLISILAAGVVVGAVLITFKRMSSKK